ncbi:MAG: HNH endonuclease [Planctomycetes bacterium]|nr:HNH endonuclease [Planctomycetota bacterium]
MVITRDKRHCRICGKPGTSIDHIYGDSNDLDNLQLLCLDCHNKKTISNIVQLKPGDERYFDVMGKKVQLDLRIDSEEPLYECDDEENWRTIYRQVILDRKQTFYKSLFPIIEAFIKQKLGKRKIAEQLNRQNVPAFSGHGKWDRHTVKTIIDLINSS